jgi:hypothetical protein
MTDPSLPPIEIVDFKAEHYSPDRKSIIVSFATRGSGQRRFYALPVQSLHGFIADLQNLQPAPGPAQGAAPAAQLGGAARGGVAPPNTVEVMLPKRWMLRAIPERKVVVMVFDPQTERQTGYALPAASIREMATALVKQAEELEKSAPGKPASGNAAPDKTASR